MQTIEKKEYHFSNDLGDAGLTVYEVFAGVYLMYSSVHMDSFDLGNVISGNLIEIHHCREGRIEQEFADEYFYLMPGDFCIALRKNTVHAFRFPLRHYHGITISIREDVARQWFSQFMEDIHIQPWQVATRLCGDRNSHIIRSEDYIEHIFSELYSVPEHIKKGYFKLKIMELFLVLSGIDIHKNEVTQSALPKAQVLLANNVAAYLSERMDQHITIQELAKEFGVSDTHLKTAFKGVYGVPVFSYMRIQKMQSAAQVLIHTDKPVNEIAYEFGYSNTSKFAAAFHSIVGDTPADYRRMHTKRTKQLGSNCDLSDKTANRVAPRV